MSTIKGLLSTQNRQQLALIHLAYPNWEQNADVLRFRLLNKQTLELAAIEMAKRNWSAIYLGEYPDRQGEALVIQTMPAAKNLFTCDVGLVGFRLLGHQELKIKVTSKPELGQIFVYLGPLADNNHKANSYNYADYLQWVLGLERVLYPADIANVVFDQNYLTQAQSRLTAKIEAVLAGPIDPLLLILNAVYD